MRRGQDRVERLTNWGPGHQAKEAWGRFSGKNWEMPRWEGRTARWYNEIRSTILFGIRAKLTRAPLSLAGWFL